MLLNIRTHFQEIVHAASSSPHTLALVADSCGANIYDANQGWGRLWRVFYTLVDHTPHQEYRLKNLIQAMQGLHRLFQSQLQSMQEHVDHYHLYLKKTADGYLFDQDKARSLRYAIRGWNEDVLPFVKLMQTCTHPKLNRLYSLCFGKDATSKNLWSAPFAEVAESLGKVIHMEGLYCSSLPFEALKKVLREKPLNALDDKAIARWIASINLEQNCIAALHGALKALAAYYQGKKSNVSQEEELARLEVFLEDKGCRAFKLADPEHMQWKKQWMPGMRVTFQENAWTLGERLASMEAVSMKEEDRVLIFTIEQSSSVLLFAQNQAVFGMRRFRQRAPKVAGLPLAHLDEVFDEGRFAIMERLHSIVAFPWKSEGDTLHLQDEPLAQGLSAMIKGLIEQSVTPSPFCTASLMYDAHYCIKSIKPFASQVFDFNALEDFVSESAAGNQAVFKYLMTQSGLYNHPAALFYQELVQHALKGGILSVEDMGGIYKMVDPLVIERGQGLVKEVKALQHKQTLTMRARHPAKEHQHIVREVNMNIWQAYQTSKACGKLL